MNYDEEEMCREDGQKGLPTRRQRVKARGVPSGYVEGLNDARTKPEAFFTIRLLDSVAFGCQTGIPHRIDGRDPVQCARVVARALGAWAERKGRTLVVELVFVRQSRLVLALHIIPLPISLTQFLRIAFTVIVTGCASGEHQHDCC